MFQKVTIIGNLGSEPDTRLLPNSGTNVCSFSVATNRKWKNNDGSDGEETVWWRVSAWGRLGEVCQQYLTKGRQVYIEGEMVPDKETGGPRLWTDNNGQQRASFEIRASTMKMLGGRDESQGAYSSDDYQQPARQQAPARPQAQQRAEPARQQSRQAAPTGGGRRSTMSAPQVNDFDDDSYNSDEIPF